MKKQYMITLIILIAGIFSWFGYRALETEAAKDTLSNAAIRFHILANSDSATDQNLKMKVKETVVNYIYQKTGDFQSVKETQNFILTHDREIVRLAEEAVEAEGFFYPVSSSFGPQEFPEKTYGDVIFPKGSYISYTLFIGKGKGHNWWCVLYPPLCFVDASTGYVPDHSKERLRESLTNQEYHAIVKYRFKYLTFLNRFLD